MRANLKIQNLEKDENVKVIKRNLSRIMDIEIAYVDPKRHEVSVIYPLPEVLELVKKELNCIGYPVIKIKYYTKNNNFSNSGS